MQTEWDLARYFYTGVEDARLVEDIAQILPRTRAFAERYRGRIEGFREASEVLAYYEEYNAVSHDISQPSIYLSYLQVLDTQNQDLLRRNGEMEAVFVEVESLLLFIAQEWKSLGVEQIMAFSRDPLLAPYRNALVGTAENLRYLLSEPEESVLNKKSRVFSTNVSLYDELSGSFQFTIEIDGETRTVTEEEIRTLRMHPSRDVRRRAFASIRALYGTPGIAITLGNVYSGIVKDWVSDVDLRGYTSVMAPRNIGEEMADETIDMLLSESERAYPIFHKFLEAKRRILGYDTLENSDISAPISQIDTRVPFEEAVHLHMETMEAFDPEFAEFSRDMLDNGRVDVFPRFGKRGGAFSSSHQGMPGFVLLNHTDRLRDVSTLSHELGHAIHGHLSQHQKSSVYHPPLCIAETASIFSEMLLADNLRRVLQTPEERLELLSETLGDIFASTLRQIQYVIFERRVHEGVAAGRELTYRDYNRMWRGTGEAHGQRHYL